VPLEVSVLCVGYQGHDNGHIRQGLPPQPPIALYGIECCENEEIAQFTEQLDFFRLVLEAKDIPCSEELLAAIIRLATNARVESQRRDFAIGCGRELARLLANDGSRLEGLLRRIHLDA
jgi:hypothetical protein